MSDFSELQLADGTPVWFQLVPGEAWDGPVEPAVDLPEGMGATVPVSRGGRGFADRAVETVRSTLRPLGPILQEIHDAVAGAEMPPQEINVTFGVQVGQDLKLGFVAGSGQAHLTVSATWRPAPAAD
ncbi:CU044_2847 family protein [Streptomyces sp. NPDC058451]|uniref:CU044_2847 family protein n=1 Tax=Streptomyces sp. NPDC058451 TaxID=3346506 RepID=UPI00365AD2A4